MKPKNFVSIAAVMTLASAAFAGEQMHTKMKIAVVDGSDDAETRIVLDSDELGFNLHDMQVGENQSVVDADGRNILITRDIDGFSFDVDGKTIKLPEIDADHDAVWVEGENGDADVDVHVMHDESKTHDGHKVKVIRKKIEIRTDSAEE